jgi:hypothetical protein
MIQIYNNREKLVANHKKGKLYRWRKFYPSYKEIFESSRLVESNLNHKEEDKEFESTEITESESSYVPEFLRKGGLIFIDDPFDVNYLNSKTLSLPLIKGLYENVRKHNIQDLTLDDIADASRSSNLI